MFFGLFTALVRGFAIWSAGVKDVAGSRCQPLWFEMYIVKMPWSQRNHFFLM